ncbi:MAG TPA: hypothetical protein VNV87_04450 [Acidimicrobiales bacterium]|jgi:hypothetical protein|nr:hypothetical protein [Acidimicrobiales bacterium]
MTTPKVVLCQPVYGHVPPAAHFSQAEMILHAGTHGHLTGICTARDTYIDWGRNHAVKQVYAQFPDFTHILWVDGDIIAPNDSLDRLLAHDRDIVGGLYHKKGPPFEPVAYDFAIDERGNAHSIYEDTSKIDLATDQLVQVGGLGLGLTLIRREVFDAVAEKMLPGVWFQTTLTYGEDVWFFHWANGLGFDAWLDTSIRCRHVGDYEFSLTDWEQAKDQAR